MRYEFFFYYINDILKNINDMNKIKNNSDNLMIKTSLNTEDKNTKA
jgi:hypothetical protein